MDSRKYIGEGNRTELLEKEAMEAAEARMKRCFREMHALMGVTTEAGELMDQFKRHIMYGKDLDRTNVIEEVGDILWYLRIFLDLYDFTFEEAMDKNVAKLRARFPNKFTEDNAVNRDLEKELEALNKK